MLKIFFIFRENSWELRGKQDWRNGKQFELNPK